VTTRLASDSRFGSQSTYPASTSVVLPSGLTRLSTAKRTVTLAAPGDVTTLSRLEEESTINGKRWLSVYTANDKTLRLTSPLGRVSSVTLDDKGRAVSWVSPGVASTQVTYDSRGRATRVAQGMRRVDVTYGANGFADSMTDGLARTTRFSTDTTGQLDSAKRPDMATYAFGWDGNGNLTSLTPPGKPAHAFAYSKVNEVTGYAPPMVAGVGKESYTWTRDSQVSSIVHPDATSTTLTRDMAGRATRVVAPWATSTYDYSPMTGQLVSSSRDAQRLDWLHDGMLPVLEASSGLVSGSVSRNYDEDFRVVELAVNDAGISYAYDEDGLLTAAGPVVMVRSATTGQLQTATTGTVTTSYTYDAYGAPASIETRVGATVVFREALTWDDIGRITVKDVTVQGTANRWEYTYDGASRLSQSRRDGQSVGVWAYDGNGNRVSADSVAATFDAQDRQLTSGAVTFGHDAFGNRTRKTEGTQVTQYVYDGVGGLLSSTLPDSTRLEYVIDSRGRRVGKKRYGNLEKGWLYDGQLRIVAELDGTGAVVSRFIYGTLSHSPDVMLRGGVTYRYVHDVLGSVRLVINVATGQVAQRIDYDSWGVITSDSSPGFQPFGFSGGLFDLDTRLTRFGARDYDVSAGRWVSPEPLLKNPAWVVSQAAWGMHVSAYAYALNNPIANVDPNGLSPGAAGFYFTPWSAAAAAATTGWGAAAVSVGATAAGAGVVAGVFAAANAGIGMFHDPPAGIPFPPIGPPALPHPAAEPGLGDNPLPVCMAASKPKNTPCRRTDIILGDGCLYECGGEKRYLPGNVGGGGSEFCPEFSILGDTYPVPVWY
jgi:RHS repeat-associated protein